MTNNHLSNQARAIKQMKNRQKPVVNILGGNHIIALPNVYAGWLDSDLMCEVIKVSPGDRVLDLCSGTGVVAIKAAQLGASEVIAVDINPSAVENIELNARKLGIENITPKEGFLFDGLGNQTFDVITINPPYTNHKTIDKVEVCFWDEDNKVTKTFFDSFRKYLNSGGRIYLGWADFADLELINKLSDSAHVSLKLLGSKSSKEKNETFLVYQLEVL